MKIIPKNKKIKPSQPVDKEKENVIKALTSLFASQGFKVRREELKRGPGWKASSGNCRKIEDKLIFIDRRSPSDEQIAFLVQQFSDLDIHIGDEMIATVPEEIRTDVKGLLSHLLWSPSRNVNN